MATQDFKDGGFYGKLGQLVGQRMGNKRIVRTYVVPANPQTPDQQANRAVFATATRLAQEAFNLNRGDPAWKGPATSEFSRRVGTALRRLHKGATEAEAFPLYPDGYVPSRVLTFGAFFPSAPGQVSIYFEGEPLPVGAECIVTVIYYSNTQGQNYTFTYTDTITAPRNYFLIPFDIYDMVYSTSYKVSVASTADGDKVLECGMQETLVTTNVHYTVTTSPTARTLTIPEADQDFFYFQVPDFVDPGEYWGQLVIVALNADGSFQGWYAEEAVGDSEDFNFYWDVTPFVPQNNGLVLAFFDWSGNYTSTHFRGNGQKTVVYY
jgi:hypothetical protein